MHTATVVAFQHVQQCLPNSAGYAHIHTHTYIHTYIYTLVYKLPNYKKNISGKKIRLGLTRFMPFADIFLLAQNKMEHNFSKTINIVYF